MAELKIREERPQTMPCEISTVQLPLGQVAVPVSPTRSDSASKVEAKKLEPRMLASPPDPQPLPCVCGRHPDPGVVPRKLVVLVCGGCGRQAQVPLQVPANCRSEAMVQRQGVVV